MEPRTSSAELKQELYAAMVRALLWSVKDSGAPVMDKLRTADRLRQAFGVSPEDHEKVRARAVGLLCVGMGVLCCVEGCTCIVVVGSGSRAWDLGGMGRGGALRGTRATRVV